MQDDFEILKFNAYVESDSRIRAILVPAWCYRIVAPVETSRPLNHFQKACLGLCATGISRVDTISEYLGIEKDLGAYVFVQMQNKGLLDEKGSLTVRGKQMFDDLSDDYDDAESLIDGYIFQDPWSHMLYPWYETELNRHLLDYEIQSDGRVAIQVATAGKPKPPEIPFVIWHPSDYNQAVPSSLEMLSAIRIASQIKRQSSQVKKNGKLFRTRTETKIFMFSNEPLRVFLHTKIYTPPGRKTWLVRDPFGKRGNPELRVLLEQVRNENIGLHKMLNKIEEENKSRGDHQEMGDHSLAASLHQGINDQFGENIEIFGDIYLLVEEMWYAHSQWADSGHFQRVQTRALLSTMGVLMEALFAVLNHELNSNVDELGKFLSEDTEVNSSMLNEMADRAGFKTPLPKLLSKISGKKLISEYIYAQGSSRPKAVIALMSSARNGQNPLAQIALKSPDLFDQLDKIARLRDSQQHYSGETPDEEDIKKAFKWSNSITRIIIDFLITHQSTD